MSKYTVTELGVEYASRVSGAPVEVGETVSLDISKDEETAVVAAGWIEHVTKPKTEKE